MVEKIEKGLVVLAALLFLGTNIAALVMIPKFSESVEYFVPDTEELIRALIDYMPENDIMIRTTLEFASKTNSIDAHYTPDTPEIIEFIGTGLSSTETQYIFNVKLQWDQTKKSWEVWTCSWEKTNPSKTTVEKEDLEFREKISVHGTTL